MQPDSKAPPSPRLERLLGFLEHDPANITLIADAAVAAYDAQDFERATRLLDRHAKAAPLPPGLINLRGLIALGEDRFEDAVAIFDQLRRSDDNPALRFNTAWARARLADYEGALALLDDDSVATSPRGPSLKIHVLHHLDRYDEALACGEALVQRFPKDEALMGALATLSLDAEKADLARHYGERAGRNAEGQAALGFLELGAQDARAAARHFEEAIRTQPGNPRAWIGKGLGLLATGEASSAVDAIDRGAELFHNHIGSWIASGYAHFVNGERDKARKSFERAMTIDPNFSECHGGLAVLDALEGNLAAAKRESQIALRLDPRSLGGALAASLLLDQSGQGEAARKIRDQALQAPITQDGKTLAQALSEFVRRSGGKSPTLH
jgi:tetratricopeptide (TPR) repeat protein